MHAIQSVAIGILASRSTYDWTIVPPGQGTLFQSLPYVWSIPFCTLHFRINHCKFMSSNKYKYASVSAVLIRCFVALLLFRISDLQAPMLSASDPYYVAKEDVAKAMDRLRGTGVGPERRYDSRLQPFHCWFNLHRYLILYIYIYRLWYRFVYLHFNGTRVIY